MSALNSKAEILSQASIWLGKGPLTTVDPEDNFAVSLDQTYDTIVQGEIASGQWGFCKRMAQLSQVAGFDPDFGRWSSAYDLPADYKTLYRLYPSIDYEIVQRRIYTSMGANQRLDMEYIIDRPVSYWSDPFKVYISYSVARANAASSTESVKMVQDLSSQESIWRTKAMFQDSQNKISRPIQSRPWIEARYRGGSTRRGGY